MTKKPTARGHSRAWYELNGFLPKKNPAAVALGSLGGKSTSEAKKAASRANGKLGGKPKKISPTFEENKQKDTTPEV